MNPPIFANLQEYPIQLIFIRDHSRLETFLVNWKVFDELYDIEYRGALIKYWRIVSIFELNSVPISSFPLLFMLLINNLKTAYSGITYENRL